MSSYASLFSLGSPEINGYADDDDDMAVAMSSYLSFDMDVGAEYPEGPALHSHGTMGDGESAKQRQAAVFSSGGFSNHDKMEIGSGGVVNPTRGGKSSKIAFKTRSEVEVLDDGYRWRKYGKKMVKNSPNPRNYYRCSSEGCHVKKRIEREREDSRYVITTYDGVHNHPTPRPGGEAAAAVQNYVVSLRQCGEAEMGGCFGINGARDNSQGAKGMEDTL